MTSSSRDPVAARSRSPSTRPTWRPPRGGPARSRRTSRVLKVGWSCSTAAAPTSWTSVRGGSKVGLFLDLKLHDIPTTVAGGGPLGRPAQAAVPHGARQRRGRHGPGRGRGSCPTTTIAAVTVLTSLDEADLAAIGLAGPPWTPRAGWPSLAVGAGCAGAGLLAAGGRRRPRGGRRRTSR